MTETREPSGASPRNRPWRRFGTLVLERPGAVVAAVLGAAALAALVAALTLRVRPGYTELLSPRNPSQARYLELLDEFGSVEALYVVVQSRDEASAAAAVDALGPAIAALKASDGKPRAASVTWQVDQGFFLDRLPAYVPADALHALASSPAALDTARALVRNPAPDALIEGLTHAMQLAAAKPMGAPDASTSMDAGAQHGLRAATALVDCLARAGEGRPTSLGALITSLAEPPHASATPAAAGATTPGGMDERGRIRLAPGAFLITVRPADTSNDANVMALLLDGVRAEARRVTAGLPAPVEVRLTGAPALVVDEMKATHRDMAWTTVVSFVLVTILFAVSFASLRHAAHAGLTLGAGLALTFGVAKILVGYLNVFSAVFGSILVGLGIDYGILFITHYEWRRRSGLAAREAVLDAYEVVGPAAVILVLSNATAFFSITLADFRGFSQLGVVSGAGLLACLVATLTLLPALLYLAGRRRSSQDDAGRLELSPRGPWTRALFSIPLAWPRLSALLGFLVVVACLFRLPALDFDYNLLNLQPPGTEAARLAEGDGPLRVSTHFADVSVGSLPEAAALEARLRRLPAVASVRSAASILPPSPASRRADLEALAAAFATATPPANASSVDPSAVQAAAKRLRDVATSLQDLAFEGGHADVVKGFDQLLAALTRLDAACARPEASAGLTAFRDTARADLARVVAFLPTLAAGRGCAPEDLPPALKPLFVGRTGRLDVKIEPRRPVWDRQALEEFVGEIRAVDARVTGPPVQILDVMDAMRHSCERAGVLSLIAILIIVAVSFRHVGGLALALAALATGFVVMLGTMAWLHLPLNPANLIALPIILGTGVDSGVPIVHRWLARGSARAAASELGHAIVLCACESLAGFGSLMLATHRGVRSFGVATCLGTLSMAFVALALLPAALITWEEWRARAGRRDTDATP